LGDDWDRIELPGERAEPIAAVSGEQGFVVVGRTCAGARQGNCARAAAAWRSRDDGATWQQATIEDGDNTFLREVTYDGSYLAFGIRFERRGEASHAVGLLWRSADGSDWRRFGSIELGECSEEGCPSASGLVTGGPDRYLLQRVETRVIGEQGAYRSSDGTAWTRIPLTAFGLADDADASIVGVTSTDAGYLALVGGEDLPLTAWTSPDAVAWASAGAFDESRTSSASLVAGSEVVAAREACSGSTCETQVWIGSDVGSFVDTGRAFSLASARVAFTGDAGYLLVGLDGAKPGAFTSLDARTWAEARPGPPDAGCDIGWLAGGPSLAILIGELGCGRAWITHGVAPG
jgi:hypothetical protein